MPVDLLKLFDQTLKQINNDRFKQDPSKPAYVPKPNMKPSMFGSKCLRKIYYSYMRVEPDFPFSDDMSRIMALGDAFHDVLKNTYRYAGILIDYYKPGQDPSKLNNSQKEFTINHPELEIKNGKMDAVLKLPDENQITKLWIAEFKSINLKGFERLVDPKPEHQIQANSYVYFFNQQLADGVYSHIKELDGLGEVVGVVYIYVCKDDGRFRQFYVKPSETLFCNTVEKIVTVQDYARKNELPPKTDDWCNSCSHRIKCKNNQIK